MGSMVGALKIAAKRIGVDFDEYTARLSRGEKWCTKCKTWKPVDTFGRDGSRADGRSAHCLDCGRVAVRKCTKGRASPFKGRKHSMEARAAMSAANLGKRGNRLGKKHTAETKARMSELAIERVPRGEDHYAWKGGTKQRKLDGRRTTDYRRWREAVFARDNYACQTCGDGKGGNLQAHHIRPYADHPELRYAVDNGKTYCRDCHERLHLKPIPAYKCRRKKHPMPDVG